MYRCHPGLSDCGIQLTQFPPPCWPIVTLSLSDPLPSTRTVVDWPRMLVLFPFATLAHGCVPNTLSIESNWTRGVRCQRRALPPASLADNTCPVVPFRYLHGPCV